MITVDRGSAVLLEVEFKRTTPFGTEDYFDPTTPKITVTDPAGTVKTNAADLLRQATGKWYYICQTETTWAVGIYGVKITSSDGTASDVTVDDFGFKLR